MSSDRTLALVHLSQVDIMINIEQAKEMYHAAVVEADCNLAPDAACSWPLTDPPRCKWGLTPFCAARIRDEEQWWEGIEKRNQKERDVWHADDLKIPRAMWGMIGIGMDRPSEGSLVTQPMRDVMDLSRRRLIVIYGPDGAGKSTAAAMWCWRRKGWYYRATGLRWWTKPGRGWNRDDGDDVRLLKQRAVAIVGLDKPWANKDGPHRHNLMHVLRERFENGLFTLLTSNLSPTDLEPLIGTGLMRTTRNAGAIKQVSEIVDGGKAEAEEGGAF